MRLSLRERLMFIKQLGILTRAGVPLFSALSLLKEHSKSKTMKKIVDQIINDVENGQYLATSMGKFKKIFGELTINIIAVGEISGTLSNNLDHLATTLKKSQTLRRKVVSASVYPIFIIIATLAITVMLTVFVFPKIIPVLKSVNYQLPWTTRLLIFTSDTTKNHYLIILLAVVFIAIGIWLLLKIEKIRFWRDNVIAQVPLVGTLVKAYNTTNICRTMGLLLNSGIMVNNSFQITSRTTSNLAYKKELSRISEQVMKGETISQRMTQSPLFPLTVSQMIRVAESTGKLSETFLYVADIYEEDLDELTKSLSNTIEPLLLIFMGILVGFIAISIITPIYGITQHLTPR